MIKAKSISIIVAGIMIIMGIAIGLTFWIRGCSEVHEKLELQAKSTWKVEQYMETIGKYDRSVPSETKNEGLLDKYPSYGTSWEITDEDIKTKLFEEDTLLRASSFTYDSMDADGNLYLKGVSTGRKLYKHTSSVGMYYGDISDDEPAVIARKMDKCQLTVEIDGNVETVTIDKSEGKSLAVILQKLKEGKHKLKITVVFGTLNVDSLLVA